MDEIQEQESEEIPECVEVQLAYDLAAIPILGVFFYEICCVIVLIKLGAEVVDNSYWIREGLRRLWIYTGRPLMIGACSIFLSFVVSEFIHPAFVFMLGIPALIFAPKYYRIVSRTTVGFVLLVFLLFTVFGPSL